MIPADPWIDVIRAQLPVARAGDDPEGVHRVRAACVRLRVYLWMLGRRTLDDDLRWLHERCGTVRDLDVMLAASPPQPIEDWLLGVREIARVDLAASLDAPRLQGLLTALAHLPPLPARHARRGVRKLARRAARCGALTGSNGRERAALHRLRRALRRLRYASEWTGREAAGVQELQDAFGRFNDLDVSLRWLRRCPHADAVPGFAARLTRDQSTARDEALSLWRARAESVETLR